MLIVVAIIAILIAISIPLINSALEKAKHATDAANERAAKAIIVVAALDGQKVIEADNDADKVFKPDVVYAYDAKNGNLTMKPASAGTYGKHHADAYIVITMSDTGTVTMGWSTTTTLPAKGDITTGTCSDQLDSNHKPNSIKPKAS